MIVIPVNNDPSQKFNIDLEGANWIFSIAYNDLEQLWYMQIDQEDVTLCTGIKMVAGVDLVRAFNIMQGQLIVVPGGDIAQDPKMDDWGTEADLLYFSPDEVAQLVAINNATVE